MRLSLSALRGLYDRLPAPARHGVIVWGGTFVAELARRVVDVDPPAVHTDVLLQVATYGAAAVLATVATASALGITAGTPLTTQYGVGRRLEQRDDASDED